MKGDVLFCFCTTKEMNRLTIPKAKVASARRVFLVMTFIVNIPNDTNPRIAGKIIIWT